MSPLRARVENSRFVLDEPTTLPEGTVVDLVADDEGDDLTDEKRRALHEALSASWKPAESGRLRPASEVLDALRRSRRPSLSEQRLKLMHRFSKSTAGGAATATRRRIFSSMSQTQRLACFFEIPDKRTGGSAFPATRPPLPRGRNLNARVLPMCPE